jgi:tRNA(Ile)-lysidine synthase
MNSVERFEDVFAQAWPPSIWCEAHVVAAISGGADSCALLAALLRTKTEGPGEIVAAHFNHGLRGAAADADADFVADFAERMSVRCVVGRGDVTCTGDGVEAAARAARYAFLRKTAEECGARYVVTAHTGDDQVETVMHRIVRGTGIAGLAGMRAARRLSADVTLIRPMLNVRRAEVMAYLQALGLTYRDDETNAQLRFTRNRIRHELLPLLRSEYNCDVDAALLRLAQLAGENQRVIDTLVIRLQARAVEVSGDLVVINSSDLRSEPRYLVRELLLCIWKRAAWPEQAMGYAEWESLADLLLAMDNNAHRQRIFPGNVQATKKGEQLTLTRLENPSAR